MMAVNSAAAHHIDMSDRAASRLDHYVVIGDKTDCLPDDAGRFRRFTSLDNHHFLLFTKSDRIFAIEAAPDVGCRGLVNAKGLYISVERDDAICKGDVVFGESGSLGSYSGSDGYQGSSSRLHQCKILNFQEVALPAPRK